MATTTTTRKILMLHGFSQNASIFSKRVGAIRKACSKDVELVFVDAPHVLQPVDLDGSSVADLGAAEVSTSDSDPTLTPRAWWMSKSNTKGLYESLNTLREILRKDRYEGVFGFSQGGAMAALLSALLERPHLHPPFLVDGKPPHPPFKFCVSVSGFKVSSPLADPIFSTSYATPTLHVIGRNDIIVIEERSRQLVTINNQTGRRVEEHDGGHFVPSKANWRHFFRDYLSDPFGNIPSPGLSSARSTTTSGTTTPINTGSGGSMGLKL